MIPRMLDSYPRLGPDLDFPEGDIMRAISPDFLGESCANHGHPKWPLFDLTDTEGFLNYR